MGKTKIEWTNDVWNPIRGCTRVSEGCRFCYAEAVAARFSGPSMPYEGLARMTKSGPRWTGKLKFVEKHLNDPLRWRKPRRIFVNSMSDLFHEKVPDHWIDRIWAVMLISALHEKQYGHTFQILTKRPERAAMYLTDPDLISRLAIACGQLMEDSDGWHDAIIAYGKPTHPSIWLGVSVEDQKTADQRIPLLLQSPAAVRFVSYEPALGPVDFRHYMWPVHEQWPAQFQSPEEARAAGAHVEKVRQALVYAHRQFVDWIIVGGESGKNARPFDIAWARQTIEQCRAAEVACFVKQLGARPILSPQDQIRFIAAGLADSGRRDPKGGDMSEWLEDLRVREWPKVEVNA